MGLLWDDHPNRALQGWDPTACVTGPGLRTMYTGPGGWLDEMCETKGLLGTVRHVGGPEGRVA